MAEGNAGPIFTDEDVRRLLAEERGEGELQGGWSLANQSDNVEVWRKAEEGVSVHLLKASLLWLYSCMHVCTCCVSAYVQC